MKELTLIVNDIKVQFRSGFYYAYIFITALYILFIYNLPDFAKIKALTIIIVSDPTVVSFYFAAAMLLLERDQSIFSPLFVTPVKIKSYILSKIISFSLLSFTTSLIITLFIRQANFNIILFGISVILSSSLFTLLGISASSYAKNINSFLLSSIFYTVVMTLPVLQYLSIFKTKFFYIFPTTGTILLIDGAFGTLSIYLIIYSILILTVWNVFLYIVTYSVFKKHIAERIGG